MVSVGAAKLGFIIASSERQLRYYVDKIQRMIFDGSISDDVFEIWSEVDEWIWLANYEDYYGYKSGMPVLLVGTYWESYTWKRLSAFMAGIYDSYFYVVDDKISDNHKVWTK